MGCLILNEKGIISLSMLNKNWPLKCHEVIDFLICTLGVKICDG